MFVHKKKNVGYNLKNNNKVYPTMEGIFFI